MSDVEARLRAVLLERADDAPDAIGLAHGARQRLRRRRTTRAVLAAAVLAAAVPLGLGQLSPRSGGQTDGRPDAADEPTATSEMAPGVTERGHRAESWHDVTFEVPVEWGYDSTAAWCADSGTLDGAPPVITRPDTISRMILCPTDGYGVTVGPADAYDPVHPSGHVWQYESDGVDQPTYPDGAWLGAWYDDGTVVTVATPDPDATRRIVDSVRRFTGADPNGCPARLGEAEASAGDDSNDSLSICRYGPDDLLAASRRLVGPDMQEAETAILSTPVRRTAGPDCPTEPDLSRTALLENGTYIATAVTDADCDGWNGIFMSGAEREVTEEARQALDLNRLP